MKTDMDAVSHHLSGFTAEQLLYRRLRQAAALLRPFVESTYAGQGEWVYPGGEFVGDLAEASSHSHQVVAAAPSGPPEEAIRRVVGLLAPCLSSEELMQLAHGSLGR